MTIFDTISNGETAIFGRILNGEDAIIDIGCHIGWNTALLPK